MRPHNIRSPPRRPNYPSLGQSSNSDHSPFRRCFFLVTPLILAAPYYTPPSHGTILAVPYSTPPSHDAVPPSPFTIAKIPLEPGQGGSLCARLLLSSSDGKEFLGPFGAIVDTGSPYLLLPPAGGGGSRKFSSPWAPAGGAAGLRTTEIYGTQSGTIRWRESSSPVVLRTAVPGPRVASGGVIFGVPDRRIFTEAMAGGDAPLLGLISRANADVDPQRNFDRRIPTLLSQLRLVPGGECGGGCGSGLPVKSYRFDAPGRTLTLSAAPLLRSGAGPGSKAGIFELADLRVYGDFVDHPAAILCGLSFDGVPKFGGRTVAAVFDTGLTGCLLSRGLWEEVAAARTAAGESVQPIRSVEVTIPGARPVGTNGRALAQPSRRRRDVVALRAGSGPGGRGFLPVAPVDLDWFVEEDAPHVVVLGMAFLWKGVLTVDAEDGRAAFVPNLPV